MSIAYFQLDLAVKPGSGGEAALVLPKVLKDQNYEFIMLKDGGEEGVIRLDAPADVIQKVEKDKKCKKLAKKQMEKVVESYPKPRIKKKYRQKVEVPAGKGADAPAVKIFELDQKGQQIIDTVQTIRAGYYLIDVPILVESLNK